MNLKPLLLVAALIVLLPVIGEAKTLKFPKDKPQFSVTVPNDWKAEITDAGIISAQPKGAAYAISIFPVQADNATDAIEETLKEVEKRFTDVEPGEPVDFRNENGVKFVERDFTGKDKGDARTLAIVAFSIDRMNYFALFQAGTPEADKRYTEDVIAIIKSIGPVKNTRGKN
ncbi:MAG TPA: hypothetical protein VM940_13510 [Chthoniobacterales bacterium]|jgi:hypothetical protein|nr:hypothetical protein [Chthoniobacterales bacterium]